MTNHPNRNKLRPVTLELLEWTRKLDETLAYYIRVDIRKRDIEGANLKGYMRHMVQETIQKAEKELAR